MEQPMEQLMQQSAIMAQDSAGATSCPCGWQAQAGADTHTPSKASRDQFGQHDVDPTPEKLPSPEDSERCRQTSQSLDCSSAYAKPIPLCLDQFEWIASLAQRFGLASASVALSALVDRANAEPPKFKRHIFLVVRCVRCLQHTRGGDKRDRELELPAAQWQWLRAVSERSRHASLGKTIRIIIDFYMPLCKEDPAFEAALVAGSLRGSHPQAAAGA
mmetsp:Transcript_24643/g.73291  ORF Transcript_24643/g.73291 Transcript_24643/m.73291 type:complete len:217 (+) Transcript_24643:79-729(+)